MTNDKERDPGSSSAEIGKYLDILAKDPKSRVFAPLAEAYRKAGLLDDAVDTALEGLRVHPNYLGGRVALGRAYFEKKQYAEAAIEMEKVAKSAPDNIIAHRILGQVADTLNDLPAAEKAFRMVLLLDPRDLEAREFLDSHAGAAAAPPSASPAPPASAPIPFDEIQEIEDLDLQVEGVYGEFELPLEPPTPQPAAAPTQSIPEPEPIAPSSSASIWPETPPPPSSPSAPIWPETAPEAPTLSAPVWPETPSEPPPPVAPPEMIPPPPVVEAAGPPLVFEKFSREPAYTPAPAPPRARRDEETRPRLLDLETTGYLPPDTFVPAAAPATTPGEEELPLLDPFAHEQAGLLEVEQEEFLEEEHVAFPVQEQAGLLEVEQEEFLEEENIAIPAQEQVGLLEVEQEEYLEEGHAAIPAQEQVGLLEVEQEEFLEEEREEPPAGPAGRGVFDTETLASIYVKQGFYGRAADIYRRLSEQSPANTGLRSKLEEVLALQRREAGIEEPLAAVAEPPAPLRSGPELTIDRLEALLETFKGGRPQ